MDAKDSKFTVELLREWKVNAQRDSWQRVLYAETQHTAGVKTEGELSARLRAAAAAELDVFRRSDKWPPTAVPLTLEVDGLGAPVTTSALAAALTTLDDLVLVAPPGMGKTATLLQIAEAALASGNASPIVLPLGDWSAESVSLLEFILKRPAFRGITESDFRAVAAKPGVSLLLDGWNELDAGSRKRAAAQLSRLQAELPELGVLISTRRQALDVPVDGTEINLLPLNNAQQLGIATALRGDAGARMLDQAHRTAGVRELVTIPLYLTALLALPEGAPFPTTKEEVLRRFVALHDDDAQRAEALAEVMHSLHHRFLEDLATTAIRAMNTTIADAAARRSISATDDALMAEGQITEKPQPITVLETLVSDHVLVRVGDPAGYSFQHQQFLEWYASHYVERLMLASVVGDAASRDKLKMDILNQPVWEEAILFACERLSRGGERQQAACGGAILAAFEVDPMLAAEMIFRSSETVWRGAAATVQGLLKRWHAPGKVDRAVGFMISSGRPEFLEEIWPLITHANDQVHLSALRASGYFRVSVLGNDAAQHIAELPPKLRKTVLSEIALNGGMDGLDLAAAIATEDPDPKVKSAVIDALAFRHANQHIVRVLRSADSRTFDLVVRTDLVDEVADEQVGKELEAARERLKENGVSAYDRLRAIVRSRSGEDLSAQVTSLIAEMEIQDGRDAGVHLLHEARSRYSRAIADGVVQRVRMGRNLFYGADDFVAAAGLSLEDDALLETAIAETQRNDRRAETAASALGPRAVGRMIGAALEAKSHLRDASGNYDQAAADRYHALLARIGHAPGSSLIGAVRERSERAGNEEMADLASLVSNHPRGEDNRGRPFDADALTTISALAENWGKRMLASSDATRSQLASIAKLTTRAPSIDLLPLLKRLLDENLKRYRAVRKEAMATGWRQSEATNEARTPHTHEYRQAFEAVNAPETADLMNRYLHDEHFGQQAASVLAEHWSSANEPDSDKGFRYGVDSARIEARRAARDADPTKSSPAADAIFVAIEPLITDGATEDQRKHAMALAIVAARLPHGQWDATIQRLLSLAPRRARASLLQSLVRSGETICIDWIRRGIAEVFEAAKVQRWILSDSGNELREWLRLLPFARPVADALTIVRDLPENQRSAEHLEEVIAGLTRVPDTDAEALLFQLAELDPKLYRSHAWRDAVMGRNTLSAARRFVDLAAGGAFGGDGTDRWHIARQIGGLLLEYPDIRAYVYQLLAGNSRPPSFELLALAVAEKPDTDGLLLLVKIETEHKRSFLSTRPLETVVTEHVPVDEWQGAYNVVPVPAAELRRKLLAMTVDGGPADTAARYLEQIDEIRDEYGIPDSEPRHPDLTSGKAWPILPPEPYGRQAELAS